MERRLSPLMRHTVRQLRRDALVARDGPAGWLRDVYFDDEEWKVRYLVVQTGGWLMPRPVLLAPAAVDVARSGEGVLRVNLSREQVNASPSAESERPVWRQVQLAHAVRFGYPYYWSGLSLWGAAGGGNRADAERAAHAELARGDPHLRSAAALVGCRVHGRDGPLGALDDFVVDERGWTIRELVVDTRRWWPGGRVKISPAVVRAIDWPMREVHVALTREAVRRLRR